VLYGEAHNVELRLDENSSEGFGLSIAGIQSKGGVYPPDIGLCVQQIKPDSVADRCGAIKKNDRLLAVNGIDVTLGTHDQVIGLIRGSGKQVTLTVASRIKVKRLRKPLEVEMLERSVEA